MHFSLLSTYQATSYPDPPRPAKAAEYDGQCPVFRRARGLRISSNTNKLSNTTVDGIDFGGDWRYPGSPFPKEKREEKKKRHEPSAAMDPLLVIDRHVPIAKRPQTTSMPEASSSSSLSMSPHLSGISQHHSARQMLFFALAVPCMTREMSLSYRMVKDHCCYCDDGLFVSSHSGLIETIPRRSLRSGIKDLPYISLSSSRRRGRATSHGTEG